jgi:glycosyltransferase involved in cell wall biosynthesis
MNYRANVEAVTLFVRNVWPLVRREFQDWRLTVVGSDPTPAVLALSDETNVEVTGTVPDVRPFYREALAAIVPLYTGGGTRLKILEAMAAGVPVVSSSLGAEGLAVSPGENILIADKDEEWLPHLSALSSQDALWRRLAANGRNLVSSRYDWALPGQLLLQTYRQWLGVA